MFDIQGTGSRSTRILKVFAFPVKFEALISKSDIKISDCFLGPRAL